MIKLLRSCLILATLLFSFTMRAQVNLNAINSAYEQNFNTLANSGTTNDISTLPTGWFFLETGTNANTSYAAGTGSSSTGNTYSFGTNMIDRALGGLLSGSLIPTIGAGFTNNTGSTITSLQVSYYGEQWRLGATGRGADRIDFQYSINATSLNSGSWIDVNALDFISPVVVGIVGALNGNDTINKKHLNFTITGLTINNGDVFFIRWLDFNVASSDDGLAIDDFTITPFGIPANQPAISFTPAELNFGEVNVNTSAMSSYQVKGKNLTDTIAVSIDAPFSLSIDSTNFNSSVTLPDSGALVYVRFTPLTDGPVSDTIVHTSGATIALFHVAGTGFDQAAHIIPIAEARTKSVGTKVTVAGRITVANEQGNPAYVQDNTGGIPVFDFNLANSTAIGDSVIVSGPIGLFNDQKQISGSGIFFTKPDSSTRMITPKLISLADLAANEGLLVTVQQVALVNKDFVFYPQSTEKITDGSIQADLRIDGDTDIPGLSKPQGVVDITGVVGRFKTNAQLLPRFHQDIPGAIEPSTPFDSIPHSKTFDVVAWNFEFFGAEKEVYGQEFGPADEPLQLQNIKRVLDSLNADIIAVEEVSNDSLFASLVAQLGHYACTCSPRYSYSFNGPDHTYPPQKVCFIYDTTTVDVLSSRVLFENRYDSARTIDPSLLPGYPTGDPSSFYSSGRLPYLLTANATIEGVTEKVSLIVIHAKSGDTAADRNRRMYDAAVLKDSLDAHFSNAKLIVLGDLNDDLDESIAGGTSPYAPFVNDTANYVAVTKTLSEAGARSTVSFNDVIDHQIITNDLQEEFLRGSETIITPFRLIPNYGTTTSDHLPVITRYAFEAPVVEFDKSAVVLSEGSSSSYTVTLTLSKPRTTDSKISLTVAGDANPNADYSTTPAVKNDIITLPLAAGATSSSFKITILDDVADELAETAIFTIQPEQGIAIGTHASFTLTIEDNDVPVISFAALLASGDEGSGAHAVKFKLSTPPATDQTVTVQVYQGPGVFYGSDYTTDPAVNNEFLKVTIPAGSKDPSFAITPLSDNHKEPTEALLFNIVSVSSGLVSGALKFSAFTIIDVKKRKPVNFAVTPNPTHDYIELISDQNISGETIYIELRNNFGGNIYSGSGTLQQVSEVLNTKLQGERRGVYLLGVRFDDETKWLRILKI